MVVITKGQKKKLDKAKDILNLLEPSDISKVEKYLDATEERLIRITNSIKDNTSSLENRLDALEKQLEVSIAEMEKKNLELIEREEKLAREERGKDLFKEFLTGEVTKPNDNN